MWRGRKARRGILIERKERGGGREKDIERRRWKRETLSSATLDHSCPAHRVLCRFSVLLLLSPSTIRSSVFLSCTVTSVVFM